MGYTTAVHPMGTFSLVANLVMVIAAIGLMWRHRWSLVSYAAMAASYGGYFYWRFVQSSPWSARGEFWILMTFLAGYWILFAISGFLGSEKEVPARRRAFLVGLNNSAFFALATLLVVDFHRPSFWQFATIYGIALLGVGRVFTSSRGCGHRGRLSHAGPAADHARDRDLFQRLAARFDARAADAGAHRRRLVALQSSVAAGGDARGRLRYVRDDSIHCRQALRFDHPACFRDRNLPAGCGLDGAASSARGDARVVSEMVCGRFGHFHHSWPAGLVLRDDRSRRRPGAGARPSPSWRWC